MTDEEMVTEVATALYGELVRQQVPAEAVSINCDELATVAITRYLAIQQRLVRARLSEANPASPAPEEIPDDQAQ